jgi:hypothetical protein
MYITQPVSLTKAEMLALQGGDSYCFVMGAVAMGSFVGGAYWATLGAFIAAEAHGCFD